MLPANPFNSSYSEMINSNLDFLTVFDSSYLSEKVCNDGAFLHEEMLSKTVFFSSASGGGKSSMLHFFTPSVLDAVTHSKEQFLESYEFLEKLGVITNGEVTLLGVNVSCARNYEIIDDIYEDGRRTQVFFALLNIRTLKEALKSILTLKRVNTDALSLITFSEIPTELSGVFSADWNGSDYYKWACEEESRICDALNNMDDIKPMMSIHNYLSIIQLMEPENIRFNGVSFAEKVLFMYDDIHRLTSYQRKMLRESLFVVRARVGVWLTQRTYGLDDNEILGLDGYYGREFISRRFEEPDQTSSKIEKTLIQIADRRAKAAKDENIVCFKSCIEDEIDWRKDADNMKKLQKAETNLNKELSHFLLPEEFLYLKTETEKQYKNSKSPYYDYILSLRAARIFVDRRLNTRQLSLADLFAAPGREELDKAVKDNVIRDAAKYYLAVEYKLPFYYGMDKLCALSFGNVYQFLNFAGSIFERKLSYRYRTKKNRPSHVSPAEQDTIIHSLADRKWEELRVSYVNAEEIMSFLSNIAFIGIKTREIGAASYSGGTYTGFGVREELYKTYLEQNPKAKALIAQCVSNNLLRKRHGKQGKQGEPVVVFYLNRWICVHFYLPLAYGGWRQSNGELVSHMCTDSSSEFASYYSGMTGGTL